MVAIQETSVTPKLLDSMVQQIVDVGSPLKIVLFGSRARGDARPDSDVDLLVIEEESDLPKHGRASRYYLALSDFLLGHDIVVRTSAEIEAWREEPNAIETTALREGKVLYERTAQHYSVTDQHYSAQYHSVKETHRPMDKRHELSQGWFRKAESDLKAAQVLTNSEGPYDTVCFHAQQGAEKYLKGLLVLYGENIPFTHNLGSLSQLCKKHNSRWDLDLSDLSTLTDYAVGTRYELTFFPEKIMANNAISLAVKVKETVLAVVIAEFSNDAEEAE